MTASRYPLLCTDTLPSSLVSIAPRSARIANPTPQSLNTTTPTATRPRSSSSKQRPIWPPVAPAMAISAAAAAATSSLVLANHSSFASRSSVRARAAVPCVRASTSESAHQGELYVSSESEGVTRRQVLGGAAAVAATVATFGSPALALNAPKGYTAVLDNADGYKFFYPFGWQEVAVKGQDVAFKDVIEPLESVSVSIIKTDKTTLSELGTADEVAKALVEKVLASPTQKTQLVEAKERDSEGNKYYTFEFLAKASNFTRHGLGTVAIKDGKFYTLTTGSNERRWNKMSDKLKMIVNSFELLV